AVLVVDRQVAGRDGMRARAGRARPVGPLARRATAGTGAAGRGILHGPREGVAPVRALAGRRHGGLVRHEPGHGTGRGIADRLRESEHRGSYSPIRSVLSISWWAVFMTSTLFWYEREAEIMLTISSTTLTLLCVT